MALCKAVQTRKEKSMRLFISADIEGVTGVTDWSETRYGGKGYDQACQQMTAEVGAACEAAMALGYEVVVKDGHEDARNLDIGKLPRGTEVIRGWRTSPAAMMGGLDESFAAAVYIGYHAPGGTGESPLAHTIEHGLVSWIKVNGELASEFSLNALWAASFGVPSVFLSGDQGMCSRAEKLCPGIVTVATKTCVGNATWSIHPQDAVERIREGVAAALAKPAALLAPCASYRMEICFHDHQRARGASWYPGATLVNDTTVSFTSTDPRELTCARMFMVGG